MRLKRRQAVTAGAAALATVGILGGTLAYFTDYDSKDLSAKAGTLKMEIADATTDLTNGLTVINPGDSNPLTFTVNNTGEKSMDIKAVMLSLIHIQMCIRDSTYTEDDVEDLEVNVEVMVSSFGEDDSRVIEFDALVTMHYENGTWKIAGIE